MLLAQTSFSDLAVKRIVFFAGKGGVGKTTSAAAFALARAHCGARVLLVSTDPAHNLSDIFGVSIGDSITPITDNLEAIEIEQEVETGKYLDQVKRNLRKAVQTTMLDEVTRQIDLVAHAPGTAEAAMFDRMVSIILDESDRFDVVVFDTAPTGHTIRLLSLPELMGVWIKGLLQRRQRRNEDYSQLLADGEPIEDPMFEVLNRRRERAAKVSSLLLNSKVTGFVFVLVPEYLPIAETRKGIDHLGQYDLHVGTLIVNKLLPESVSDPFFQGRLDQQQQYRKQIDADFPQQAKLDLPLLSHDINTLQSLETISRHIERALVPKDNVVSTP
ncbi:MAG: ArsA family ATPase [Betaproteobacteria bacterium]|nr:MAG: ArsA family ATPase [Betaproteobacteria bacterium]